MNECIGLVPILPRVGWYWTPLSWVLVPAILLKSGWNQKVTSHTRDFHCTCAIFNASSLLPASVPTCRRNYDLSEYIHFPFKAHSQTGVPLRASFDVQSTNISRQSVGLRVSTNQSPTRLIAAKNRWRIHWEGA